MDSSQIIPLLERLFTLLGKISITCNFDKRDCQDPRKVIMLTQSYSSTLAHEIITLIRSLHCIVGWNQAINAFLLQKLRLAADLFHDGVINMALNELNDADQPLYLIVSSLNVIGGIDNRPRIGGVTQIEDKTGTISKITPKGKLIIQIHETGEEKKVLLTSIKPLSDIKFNLDRMPMSENLINTWSILLLGNQKYASGFDRRPTNTPGHINLAYLRQQQHILSTLSATRALANSQSKLRRVLRHQDSTFEGTPEILSQDEDSTGSPQPVMLFQKVLAKATQPSPLKPIFSLHEIIEAALNISQFLAAECNKAYVSIIK